MGRVGAVPPRDRRDGDSARSSFSMVDSRDALFCFCLGFGFLCRPRTHVRRELAFMRRGVARRSSAVECGGRRLWLRRARLDSAVECGRDARGSALDIDRVGCVDVAEGKTKGRFQSIRARAAEDRGAEAVTMIAPGKVLV